MKISKSDLLMASAAFAWGFSYVFMKWGLDTLAPFQLIFLQFGIAFPVLLLVFRKKAIPTLVELKYSFFLSIAVFALSIGYTYGLKTTEASTAGFLAGTTVAMVPILNGILKRKFPEKKVVLAACLAFGGIAVMSLTKNFSIAGGAWLCIGGAMAYAIQIIITNHALAKCRPLVIAIWQLGITAAFGGVAAVFAGQTTLHMEPLSWVSVLGLALVSSAYGYIAQTVAQKHVVPERIGFIYALEPVFCAILALVIFQEVMSVREIIGAIMILGSILI